MLLPKPSRKVPHPDTGDLTPVWTRRKASEILDTDVKTLVGMEGAGMIPPPLYGSYNGSPYWSLRQITFVAAVLKWAAASKRDGDKFSEDQLKRQLALCRKEWNDEGERLLGGNHRNAKWRARRLFGLGRNAL